MLTLIFIILGVLACIAVARWPVLILAIYLTTGLVKAAVTTSVPVFQALDYTLVAIVLTLLVGGVSWRRWPPRFPIIEWKPIILYSALAMLMTVSMLWTSASLNVSGKLAMQMGGLNLMALFIPYLFLTNFQAMRQFLVLQIIVSAVVCVVVVTTRPEIAWHRSGFLGNNPLAAAEYAVVLMLLIPLTLRQFRKAWRFFLVLLIPLACYAYIMTGSRGAILRLGITLCVATVALVKKTKAKVGILVGAAIISAMFFVAMRKIGTDDHMTRRILSLTQPWSNDTSIEARMHIYAFILRDINVIGHGLGTFAVRYGAINPEERPHLTPLEVLYEFGIIGAVIWMGFLVVLSRVALSRNGLMQLHPNMRQLRTVFSVLFLYYLVTHLTSSNMVAARDLCFYGSVAIACVKLSMTSLWPYASRRPVNTQALERLSNFINQKSLSSV